MIVNARCLGTLLLVLLAGLAAPATAADLPKPTGTVLLTVTGKIGKTNRGPFDEFEDAIFKYHEKSFEKAAAFDIDMLDALGRHEVTVSYDQWPGTFRFQGPWLKDLLAAVEADGESLVVTALDGYAQEYARADIDKFDWIVGVRRDGRLLEIGQRGPVWIVYRRKDDRKITEADDQRWPWAAYLIEVK